MKKNLLLIFAISMVFLLNAQITIVSTDVIDANSVVCNAIDTMPDASINPGPAGADQTWDFSALVLHERDTMVFVDPAFTPYDTSFVDDNIAFYMGGEDMWSYLKKTSTYIESVGAVGDLWGTGTPMEIEFNPRETIIQFPVNYMDSFVDTSGFEFVMDTVKVELATIKTVSVDAWGSVTTPFGTYNALRVQSEKIESQTFYMWVIAAWVPVASETDTSYSYEWWTNEPGVKYPVVSFDWLPAVDSVDGEVEYLEDNFVNTPEIYTNETFNTYPNPSNGIFNITTDETGVYRIYNYNGQVVTEGIIKSNSTNKINISDQPSGIYLLRFETSNGLQTRKLVIQ